MLELMELSVLLLWADVWDKLMVSLLELMELSVLLLWADVWDKLMVLQLVILMVSVLVLLMVSVWAAMMAHPPRC